MCDQYCKSGCGCNLEPKAKAIDWQKPLEIYNMSGWLPATDRGALKGRPTERLMKFQAPWDESMESYGCFSLKNIRNLKDKPREFFLTVYDPQVSVIHKGFVHLTLENAQRGGSDGTGKLAPNVKIIKVVEVEE